MFGKEGRLHLELRRNQPWPRSCEQLIATIRMGVLHRGLVSIQRQAISGYRRLFLKLNQLRQIYIPAWHLGAKYRDCDPRLPQEDGQQDECVKTSCHGHILDAQELGIRRNSSRGIARSKFAA